MGFTFEQIVTAIGLFITWLTVMLNWRQERRKEQSDSQVVLMNDVQRYLKERDAALKERDEALDLVKQLRAAIDERDRKIARLLLGEIPSPPQTAGPREREERRE